MSAIDWSDIFTKYKGKWVALQDDEQTVIAAADSAKEVLAVAKKKGFKNPILTKMPSDLLPFVG